jgi:hypothetical protein
MSMGKRVAWGIASFGAAALVAACSDTSSPVGPGGPLFAVNAPATTARNVNLCKDFDPDDAVIEATFTVSVNKANGVADPAPFDVSLNDGECVLIWNNPDQRNGLPTDPLDTVTVTEHTLTGYDTPTWTKTQSGTQLGALSGTGSVVESLAGESTGSVIIFTNKKTVVVTGCTLTQGYWKTHSSYGPASSDPNWLTGGNSPDNAFFNSGKTWIEIWGIAPGQGPKQSPPIASSYLQLAHQYMAAVLNIANGATAPQSVLDAIDGAETFFSTGTGFNSSWAGILAAYNEGTTGPGHCEGTPID